MYRKILFTVFFLLSFTLLLSVPSILSFSDRMAIPNTITLDLTENRMYVGYSNGKFGVWNNATGKLIEMVISKEDNSPILSSALSSNRNLLALGRKDGQIEIWSVDSLKVYGEFIRENNSVWAMEFEKDDKYLVTGNADGRLRRWNVDTKNLENIYTRHRRNINSAEFSSDGKYLVTGSSDNTIILWDVENGELIEEMTGHNGWVTSISFSPNSKFLLTGSTDKTAKVWAIPRGYQLRNLGPFDSEIWSVSFVSENLAVIGEASGDLSLWNVETAKEIRRVNYAHKGAIRVVKFSEKSQQIFTGSNDGTIKMWDSTNLNLIATFVIANDGEWISYMPLGKYVSSVNALSRNDFYISDNGNTYSFEEYVDFLVKVDYLPIGDIFGPKIELSGKTITPRETTLNLKISDDAAVREVSENGITYSFDEKTVNIPINFDIMERETSVMEVFAADSFGNTTSGNFEIEFDGFRFYLKEDYENLRKNSLVLLKSIKDGKFLIKFGEEEKLVPKNLLVMTPYAPDISISLMEPRDIKYNRTNSEKVKFRVSINDVLGIKSVNINREQKIDFKDAVKDFSFEQEFPLNFGENNFYIVANNIENITKESSISVTRVERNPPVITMPLLPEEVFADDFELNFMVSDDYMVSKVVINGYEVRVNSKKEEVVQKIPVLLGRNDYKIEAIDFFTNSAEVTFNIQGVRKMYSLKDGVPVEDSKGNRLAFLMKGEEVTVKEKSGNYYKIETEDIKDALVDWKFLDKIPPDLYKPGLANLSAEIEGDFIKVKGIAYDDIRVERIEISGNRVTDSKQTTVSISGYPVRDSRYFETLIKIYGEEIKPVKITVYDNNGNFIEENIYPKI